jgi:cell wall-associated NlpC family hydrolase
VLTPLAAPVALPIAKSWLPAVAPQAPVVHHALYAATAPSQPVTIKQLDAALVDYLGLSGAAREIQLTLQGAGLQPPANTGTEAVARMLELRLNHPSGQDDLELLPFQPATRAEAAWSFAQVLRLDQWAVDSVQHAADTFTLPGLTTWQRQILTSAVHYVGYPYVWGGTSPGPESEFGVRSAGGFDCSGFVWRVYKLTQYAGAPRLSGVLRGRTTYEMSGEVPHRELIPAAKLQPADVMFFGAHGRQSKPSEVDHTALYLGNGWFIQSSGEGVTLLPFDGWYTHSYAWGRRPLREAGLTG